MLQLSSSSPFRILICLFSWLLKNTTPSGDEIQTTAATKYETGKYQFLKMDVTGIHHCYERIIHHGNQQTKYFYIKKKSNDQKYFFPPKSKMAANNEKKKYQNPRCLFILKKYTHPGKDIHHWIFSGIIFSTKILAYPSPFWMLAPIPAPFEF